MYELRDQHGTLLALVEGNDPPRPYLFWRGRAFQWSETQYCYVILAEPLASAESERMATAFDVGRIYERFYGMTNEALRAAILSGIDTITGLPGFRLFSSLEQRNILAAQRMYWQQADDAALNKLGLFRPATFGILPKGFNPAALLPALLQTAAELPVLLAEGGRVAAIWGPVFTPKFDWSKVFPAVEATAAEWPAIFAEGGKLVEIWLPVFGTPAA